MLLLLMRYPVRISTGTHAFMTDPEPGIPISNKEHSTLARRTEKFSQKSQFTGIRNEENITFTLHGVCCS
ncbi:Uncharacterised protein [Enterobacter hormaechei]|mgnify:FL=1|nr:Uncharacterised protein [Enterobacter hormaechei]SAC04629.1 Uncharacterised protein [Enterobacter hormaechei]